MENENQVDPQNRSDQISKLLRRRNRNNLFLLVALATFALGMFAMSFLHLQQEAGTAANAMTKASTVTN
jgi:flagellar basal body-associated protein FliL